MLQSPSTTQYCPNGQTTDVPPNWPYQTRPGANFAGAWQTLVNNGATGSDATAPIADIDTGLARIPDYPQHVTYQVDVASGQGTEAAIAPAQGASSHGNQTAGIMVAATGNGIALPGAAQNTDLLFYRAATQQAPNSVNTHLAATAVIDAAYRGARVILLPFASTAPTPDLGAAVARAQDLGAVVVADAGSSGNSDPAYPASYPGVIGVSAIDDESAPSNTDSFGPDVDLAAPGVNIKVDDASDATGYSCRNGSAYAAAFVAAAASLVLRANPALAPGDVTQILTGTARDITVAPAATGSDPYTGTGALDAGAAVNRALASVGQVAPWITADTDTASTAGQGMLVRLGVGGATNIAATGLPVGLAVGHDGIGWYIQGAPTKAGAYPVTLTATGPRGAKAIALTITVAHGAATRVTPNTGLTRKRLEFRTGIAATVLAHDAYGNTWTAPGTELYSRPGCKYPHGKGKAVRTCTVKVFLTGSTLSGAVKLKVYDGTRLKVKAAGTPKPGKRIKAVVTPKHWPVAYQWYKNGHKVKGHAARKYAYRVPKSVKHAKYTVKVTLAYGRGKSTVR
ncbi:MAG: S8 family serine peptidase, partial [Bifidobacteriaceae bacterium]|nr:S8 family serine peptidase [Bifidobacteriaceae bacterium]